MKQCVTLACLLLCLLTGCSLTEYGVSEPDVPETTQATEPPTEPAAAYDIGSDIAVISITTADQSEGVMDFVTKPVAAHVAKDIASWTPGYQMPPAPYYESCTITVTDEAGMIQMQNVPAEVKVRGNWTTTYDKKPLRIKFTETQNLLGLNDGAEMKNWVLLAGYKDATLLRDKTALAIGEALLVPDGLYVADSQLVEVEINGEYWGMYLLTEQQQINRDRVAITEAPAGYTGTDIGYFLEFDGYYKNEDPLQQVFVDYADNAPLVPFDGEGGGGRTMTCLSTGGRDRKKNVGMTIKSDIYAEEQRVFIETYLNQVYRILYAAAYEDTAYTLDGTLELVEREDLTPQQAVEAVVDVQSLADMYLLSELTCDADIYWSSFFLSVDHGPDGDGRVRFEAPWDYDSALGNKKRCMDGQGFYAANIVPDVNDSYETIHPWLAVLMYEDWFCEIIRETWTAAYDAGAFDEVVTMIADEAAQYEAAFARNEARWGNILDNSAFRSELCSRAAKCRTHADAAAYLQEWLTARIEFLNEYWHA